MALRGVATQALHQVTPSELGVGGGIDGVKNECRKWGPICKAHPFQGKVGGKVTWCRVMVLWGKLGYCTRLCEGVECVLNETPLLPHPCQEKLTERQRRRPPAGGTR